MSKGDSVPVVGLVGGVGSGKTALSNRLKSRRRILVIDGDAAGHAVLASPSIQNQLRQVFGDSIFDDRGQVNRKALARLVFGPSPAHRRARTRLERIVHPEIRKLIERQVELASQREDVEAVLLDAAVLFEAGWNDLCDAVVFIDVPFPTRLKRVQEKRNWNQQQLKARESSQLPVKAKREKADVIIGNTGTVDDAARQLEQVVDRLLAIRHNGS